VCRRPQLTLTTVLRICPRAFEGRQGLSAANGVAEGNFPCGWRRRLQRSSWPPICLRRSSSSVSHNIWYPSGVPFVVFSSAVSIRTHMCMSFTLQSLSWQLSPSLLVVKRKYYPSQWFKHLPMLTRFPVSHFLIHHCLLLSVLTLSTNKIRLLCQRRSPLSGHSI